MSTVIDASLPYELRWDPVAEVVRDRLWLSGSRAPRTELPDNLDAIITVGEARQPWLQEWYDERVGAITRENFRLPVVLNARLIDARGMLDVDTASATAHFGNELLRSGRRMLIHCDAGHFRSVFMAALISALWFQVDGTSALYQVRTTMRWYREPGHNIGIPDYDSMLASWNCHPFGAA